MPKQSENKKQKSRMASFGMPFLTRSSLMSLVCRLSLSHRHYIVRRNGSTSSSNDDWNGNVMMRVSWCCYSHLVCRLFGHHLVEIYLFLFLFVFFFFSSSIFFLACFDRFLVLVWLKVCQCSTSIGTFYIVKCIESYYQMRFRLSCERKQRKTLIKKLTLSGIYYRRLDSLSLFPFSFLSLVHLHGFFFFFVQKNKYCLAMILVSESSLSMLSICFLCEIIDEKEFI